MKYKIVVQVDMEMTIEAESKKEAQEKVMAVYEVAYNKKEISDYQIVLIERS